MEPSLDQRLAFFLTDLNLRRWLKLSLAAGVIVTDVSAGDILGALQVVTPAKASITLFVLSSLGLELLATRHAKFSDKLLDHVDCCSGITKMLAS